jgi:hypothetical protein
VDLTPTPTVAPRGITVAPQPRSTPTRRPVVKPPPAPRPSTTRPRPRPSTKPPGTFVHPGAFCSPVGATGHTSTGTLMRCTLKAGDARARWRKA